MKTNGSGNVTQPLRGSQNVINVIFNADDFGASPQVNEAVMRAHSHGMLMSTSLMVTGDAAADAVALARHTPTLAVGLHLVLVQGRAALAHRDIPHLVDSNGNFSDDALRAGLVYFFDRRARKELALEIAAQFERFAATGLPLSHVDGHLHLHVHPAIFSLLIPLAETYGAAGLRIPSDDLLLALRYDRRGMVTKTAWAVALGLVNRWCRHQLRGHQLLSANHVYGVMQSGQMDAKYVQQVLRQLDTPLVELYFHPATVSTGQSWGPNPVDLATLLSPSVRQTVAQCALHLSSFPQLKKDS
jgi:hopanoid biosynthesis associated protein HpnK